MGKWLLTMIFRWRNIFCYYRLIRLEWNRKINIWAHLLYRRCSWAAKIWWNRWSTHYNNHPSVFRMISLKTHYYMSRPITHNPWPKIHNITNSEANKMQCSFRVKGSLTTTLNFRIKCSMACRAWKKPKILHHWQLSTDVKTFYSLNFE